MKEKRKTALKGLFEWESGSVSVEADSNGFGQPVISFSQVRFLRPLYKKSELVVRPGGAVDSVSINLENGTIEFKNGKETYRSSLPWLGMIDVHGNR